MPTHDAEIRAAAEVFPPGEFLREELEARGWTQQELATILGRPLQTVNQIINGRKEITPETAIELAEALGTSAEIWLNLESAYRLAQAKAGDPAVRRRARLFHIAACGRSQVRFRETQVRHTRKTKPPVRLRSGQGSPGFVFLFRRPHDDSELQ